MMINTDAVKAVETLDMESEVLITSPGKNVPYKMKVAELVAAVETNKKKVYKALLTQTGTSAPTAVVLENTLGNVVWEYAGVGMYSAALKGAFTEDKTFVLTTPTLAASPVPVFGLLQLDINSVGIGTSSGLTSDFANGILYNSPIQIEVYS